MTRYTNVARKRTYVQAGFEPPDGSLEISTPQLNSRASDAITIPGAQEDNQMPQEPKKKRRRRGKSKPEGNPETSPSIQPTKTGDYPEQIEETTTKTDGRSLKKSRTYQERQLKGDHVWKRN